MNVAIVTDSTAYMPADLLRQYHIHVVPSIVNWSGQSFHDGVDMTAGEFFARLKTDPVHPTTAAASIGEIRDIYASATDHAEAVVGIHLSAKLSGTYSAAVQVKELLPGKRVEVIDAETTAMAMGFVVLAAARAAATGAPIESVVEAARATIPHVGLIFTVDTLEYLRRGGRIGGAAAFIGNLMDVKPLLAVRDGKVEPMERARTKKKAVARVLELITEKVKGQSPVRLATIHAAAEAEARALLDAASAQLSPVEAHLAEGSPTVCVHAGPGTVGLAWCAGL